MADTKISEAAVEAALDVYYAGNPGHGPRALKNVMRRSLAAALPHLQPAKPEAVRLRDELLRRTPADYAIEHAGYLVTAAKQLLEARNEFDALLMRLNEDGEIDEDEVQATGEAVGDASHGLRLAIHEFNKRRDRALAATGKQQVGEVEWDVLASAARAGLPFIAYAFAQGVDGAEEAGRAIEAALAVRQPGTNAPDVEAVLADRIRRLSRYTHVGWRDPFTGAIKSDMVLAPDGEWVRLGYVRHLLDGRDAGTGVGNG